MLDCGIPPKTIPDNIFITHGHLDHVYGIPTSFIELVSFKLKDIDKTVNIYLPEEIATYTKNFIHHTYVLSKNNPNPKIHSKYKIIGLKKDNIRIPIKIRNKDWILETIKCDHTVPCLGYGFSEIRKKLKDEYKGLEGRELGKLKRDGVVISKTIEIPQFCYLGDSSIKVLENNSIFKYPIIMVECTYIGPETIDLIKSKKHIHWNELVPYIKKYSDTTFILYHFSKRYKSDEIWEFFNKISLKNIVIWAEKNEDNSKN